MLESQGSVAAVARKSAGAAAMRLGMEVVVVIPAITATT